MLVSNYYRFIYTKTVKTAGTSVEAYFEPYCMHEKDYIVLQDRPEYVSDAGVVGFRGNLKELEVKPTWWNHMPAALIKKNLGTKTWDEYFKFCVIRNPYDLVISWFFFHHVQNAADKDSLIPKNVQFEQWLTDKARLPIGRSSLFIDGKLCVDHVIRYERLHTDIEEVCKRLGILWEPEKLLKLKAGIRPSHATAEAMYTERTKEIVRKAFALELDTFQYTFPK